MICAECVKEGERSTIYDFGGSTGFDARVVIHGKPLRVEVTRTSVA